MNPKSLVLLAIIFTLISFKSENPTLKGTWKGVSQEIIRNGISNMTILDKTSGGQLKTWSDQYFLFVGHTIAGSQIQHAYGGGTYELSGTQYTETIQYHISPNFRGRTVNLYLEIKGDTLIQIYPVDNKFHYDKDNCNVEKYIRLD